MPEELKPVVFRSAITKGKWIFINPKDPENTWPPDAPDRETVTPDALREYCKTHNITFHNL